MSATASSAARHPRGLMPLFFTEMWERFSFYLMLGLLYQYLTDSQKGGMGWSGKHAASVYGSYLALVYFTPFVGGLLADRVLGLRRSIVIGGVTMMFGHIVLAVPADWALYTGLVLLCAGNGFFKPNVSTIVGNLYPTGSPLRDSGYNIFYMGINVGAFLCNFVASIVRNKWGWHAAFATAGVGMAIGLVVFLATQRTFAHADRDPRERTEPAESLAPFWLQCIGPAVVLGAIGVVVVDGLGWDPLGLGGPTTGFVLASVPVVLFYVNVWRGVPDPADRGRVAALLAVFAVVVVFWAIFHQNGTALTDWAVEDTDRRPTSVVRTVADAVPDFAENAPPLYFANAEASTPRPHRDTFLVVSDVRYRALQKRQALTVEDGHRVNVTRKILDDVYRHTSPRTRILPRGEHLKLVNAEIFQSVNPGFVILLTPLLVALWRWLSRRRREPTTAGKIALGLLITAGGPVVMLLAVLVTRDGAVKASSWWLIGTYAMLTVGELCLSPMGLSLVSKMAPKRIRAFMMGGWFVATALGNKLSGVFGEVYQEWDHVKFYVVLIACVLVATGAITVLLPWMKRQMSTEAET